MLVFIDVGPFTERDICWGWMFMIALLLVKKYMLRVFWKKE